MFTSFSTTRGRLKRRTLLAAATAAWLVLPAPVASQSCPDCTNDLSASTTDHVILLSVNALIGGITAGLARLASGDPLEHAITDGFSRGAVGGGMSYFGKRVAVSDFEGAGLLGRQLATLGATTTANAAAGIGVFDRIMLQLAPFPARLVITKNGSRYSARPMVDLLSAAAVVYGFAVSRYSLDWDASLSGGVAVFRERDPLLGADGILDVSMTDEPGWPHSGTGYRAGATSIGGVALVSYLAPEDEVLAHERVHTIQFDFITATLSDPADTWMLERAPGVDRWLKLNLVPLAFGAINQTLESLANHDNFPWEREAILLSGRR